MSIRVLPEDVVNKIAAGEVLVRPSNAVKELVENSVDAGASTITITIGNGGLQTIQVVDNGKGISRADHPLVCRRFATSKLASADDLSSGKIGSFGFRGEALASMSLVGHVSVFSKSSADQESTGFETRYMCGVPLPNFPAPVPFAGESGTRIVVDDLFFSNPVRKKAFKSSSAEYKRILDVVAKFAVVFPHIGFTVRKAGEVNTDLAEEPSDDRVSRIESVMNVDKRDLIRTAGAANLPHPLVGFECIVWNPNSSVSSKSSSTMNSVAVVNNRIIDHSGLVKLIESEIVSSFQTKPKFVFVSLTLDPRNIDINVCPTKGKVIFSNQAAVERFVCDQVVSTILESRKVKVVKLNKISFVPVRLAQSIHPETSEQPVAELKLESQEPATQQFRIHTCAKQNMFRSSSQDSQFLELTQMDRLTQCEPQPDEESNAVFDEICSAMNGKSVALLDQNPRDFVFVGDLGDGLVVCQLTSRLCICNIKFSFQQLVGCYLLASRLSLVNVPPILGCNIRGVPEWVQSLLAQEGDGAVTRLPSIRGVAPEYSDSAVSALLALIAQDERVTDDLCEQSLAAVCETCSEWLWENEFKSDAKLVWDEVLRNKLFAPTPTEPKPIQPLKADFKRNFFFREIISLKELYKDFERC